MQVEPVVIVNGCVDNTAEIARGRGVTVLSSIEEGKTRALQTGLEYLGERALSPVLLLDADTVPVFKTWSEKMVKSIQSTINNQPAVGWGPLRFAHGTDRLSDIVRTVRSNQIHIADRDKATGRTTNGSNMILNLRSGEVLQALLEMDNYWEYGDRAVADLVVVYGGIKKHILSPRALVNTDGSRFPSLRQRLGVSAKMRDSQMDEIYRGEAAETTVVYNVKPAS
jgi:hypothetical protein